MLKKKFCSNFLNKISMMALSGVVLSTSLPSYSWAMENDDFISKSTVILPKDNVLSIEDQIGLYRNAYRSFNKPEINVQDTHIPGLIPLIRMGYNYTEKGLEKSDQERLNLLKIFWSETEKAINLEKLTPQYFKDTNLRLALLLNDKQEKSLFFQLIEGKLKLYTSGDWKDLNKYSQYYNKDPLLKVEPFPFCFEATLYHPKGELSLENFFDAYLHDDFSLGLTTIPYIGEGPHGNYIKDSAGFKFHDDAHLKALALGFRSNLKAWDQIKTIAKKVYSSEEKLSPFNKVVLFLLLHEFEPNEDYCNDQFSSKEEPLIRTKEMPFSERKIFAHWINNAANEVHELVNSASECFENSIQKASLLSTNSLPIFLNHTKCKAISEDAYIFDVDVIVKSKPLKSESNTEKAAGDGEEGNNIETHLIIGTAKAHVLFEPTFHSSKEKIMLQKLTNISLTSLDAFELPEDLYLQKNLESLKNHSEEIYSRSVIYEAQFIDLENLVRLADPTWAVQTSPTVEEIKEKVCILCKEFFDKHKDLLSDSEMYYK